MRKMVSGIIEIRKRQTNTVLKEKSDDLLHKNIHETGNSGLNGKIADCITKIQMRQANSGLTEKNGGFHHRDIHDSS